MTVVYVWRYRNESDISQTYSCSGGVFDLCRLRGVSSFFFTLKQKNGHKPGMMEFSLKVNSCNSSLFFLKQMLRLIVTFYDSNLNEFRREASILQALSHPTWPEQPAVDAGHERQHLYYFTIMTEKKVMQYFLI